jgi:hypothetical protein
MASDINELISPEALKSVNDLEATFAKIVTVIDSIIAKSKSLDQVITTLNKEADVQSQLNKAAKDAINLNKQQQLAEDDIVRAKIAFQNATKDQREELKALVTLEDSEAGYLEKVRAKISQLNQEKNKIKETDKDWQKQIANINKEIDKNNEILKENSSALGKQKIGIGGYADGIKTAAGSLLGFTSVAGAVIVVADQIKKAFEATEGGLRTMSQASSLIKQFWYNLVEEGKIGFKSIIISGSDALRLDDFRKKQRQWNLEEANQTNSIKDLRLQAAAAGLSETEKLEKLTMAEDIENKLIQDKTARMKTYLGLLSDEIKLRPNDTKLLDEYNQKEIELRNTESDYSLRLASKVQAETDKVLKQREEAAKKELELREKTHEELDKLDKYWLKERQKSEEDSLKTLEGAQDYTNKYLESSIGTSNKEIESDQAKHVQELEKINKDDYKLGTIDEKTYLENELNLLKLSGISEIEAEKIIAIEKKEIDKKAADDKIKLEREKYKIIGEIAKEAEQIENNIIDGKIQKLEQQKNAELSDAKLTADQKTAINDKYAKEEAKLKRKAAIAEKLEGIFSIAISTAKNITAASNPIMMAMIPWIIAQGVAEAAVVASKPLPSYAKGTHYASGGPSVVSEQGREMIISPSGAISLSPDDPTIMNIERGSKIIPSEETKRIIEAARITKRNDFEAVTERRHKELINTIKNKRELILSSSTGHYITEREGSTYKNYFKRHLQ